MAVVYAGNEAIDREGCMVGDYTYIMVADGDYPYACPIRGIIKSFDVYVNGATNIKLKVFRDDGTNYVYIGESPLISCGAAGLYSGSAFVKVERGDKIGFYVSETSYGVVSQTFGSDAVYQAGDITTTTAKSAWTETSSERASFLAYIYSIATML